MLWYVTVTCKRRTPRSKRHQYRYIVQADTQEAVLLRLRAEPGIIAPHFDIVDEYTIEPHEHTVIVLRSTNVD